MKKLVLTLSIAWMATGCVLSPDGNFYPEPTVGVGVGGASVDITPRVYNGSRSRVSVWLHPTYTVADAYPIAQAHCNRWGFYARPAYDWTVSASIERRLNYTCVSYRPVLAGPHIIVGSPFYRNHYRHWHNGRRFGRTYPRRGTVGRGAVVAPRRGGRVFTPKPVPRHRPTYRPSVRRGTFGRGSSAPAPRNTTVQRGKPWEHNTNKNRVVIPNPGTTVQRGKPWEHNRNKGVVTPRVTPTYKSKRTTFGRSGNGVIKKKTTYKSKTSLGSGFGSTTTKSKTTYKRKSGFGSIKPKTSYKSSRSGFGSIKPKSSSRRSRKGRLTL